MPKSRLILLSALLFAPALTGCVTPQPLVIPDGYRLACARAPVGDLATEGDLAALIVGQEKALSDCDSTRGELVRLIDGAGKGRQGR